jgi:phage repressor protein C with HTH and peptisase S24 domain
MRKYERIKSTLKESGVGKMKAFGNSMLPIFKSGSLLTYEVKDKYEIGDIVFCKVRGKYIEAHKITKIDEKKGYMIANNKGFENGWTKTIYGYVTEINGEKRND